MDLSQAAQKFTSDCPGVSRDNKKWKVRVRVDGKEKHLGRFATELDAMLAWAKWQWDLRSPGRQNETRLRRGSSTHEPTLSQP